MTKYVIGIDFGTLSGRALLMDAQTGREIAESTMEYKHAVMDTALPSGKKLPPNYALQHPADYLEVLQTTVRNVVSESGVSVSDIVEPIRDRPADAHHTAGPAPNGPRVSFLISCSFLL